MMKINIDEIQVKVKIIEEKNLKAIVSLDFGDFAVKGFRIAGSEYENSKGDKLWVTPPSYKNGGGRYHPIFYAPDKELWQKLEAKILEEYDRESKEYYKKRFDLKDNPF